MDMDKTDKIKKKEEKNPFDSRQNQKQSRLMAISAKILTLLFYLSMFLLFLSVVMMIIIFFVQVETKEMILPPLMKKILDENGEIIKYELFLGNGLKINANAADVTLGNIKTVIYSEFSILLAVLLTVIPIFKFLSALIRNINNHFFRELKNVHYIYFIGMSMFLGGILIKFITRFYNYTLISTFVKDTATQIELSLSFDFIYGLPGVLIIILGFLVNYIFKNLHFEPSGSYEGSRNVVPMGHNEENGAMQRWVEKE